ncbi:hypothetical protein ACFXKR_21750 [Streptomyces violascens]|uniref:hypothetical protein n=1 Tax=Streptomyces violascens TaxID=67381 RepID=UPI0036AC2B42
MVLDAPTAPGAAFDQTAVRDTVGIISGLVLIDAVGVRVEGEPMRDFFGLDARGIAEHAWHDSARYYVDPATVPPEQFAARRADMETMRILAGEPYMHDPKLLRRLGRVRVPALLLWGGCLYVLRQARRGVRRS